MKKYIIIYLLLLLPSGAFARKLTPEDCRTMALEHNRTFKNASLGTFNAKDNLKGYRANYLPKISATGNYLYSTGKLDFTIPGGYLPTFVPNLQTGGMDPNILTTLPDGTPIFKEYAWMPDIDLGLKIASVFSAGVMAEQPIYMGGKVRSSVKMGKLGVELSSLNEKRTEAEVIEQTDNAYWTYVKTRELLKCADSYKAVVDEFYRQMRDAAEVGLKTKNDLLKVQVRLNEAELRLRQAENGVRLARMNLCRNIGLPLTTQELEVSDSLDADTRLMGNSLDVTARPEYRMLEKQVELKKQNVNMTRSDFLPQIAAVASYNYTNGGKFNGETLFNSPSFIGGVTMSIPIFHWSEGRKKVSVAEREMEMSRNEFEDLAEKMQLELMQAIYTFEESELEVALTEKSVAQAEENMRMSRDQYDAGMETLGDYLEAQALWQKAQSDLVQAKSAKRFAYTKYLKAAGKTEQLD